MFKFVVVLVPLTTGVTGFIHGVFPGLNQQAQLLLTYGSSPLRPADEDTGPSDPAPLLWTRRLDAGVGVQLRHDPSFLRTNRTGELKGEELC